MVRLKICGVPVEIPYAPYPSQIATMSRLLSCMKEGGSALVESPTGTGKSLAILCAVLAFSAQSRRESEDGAAQHPIFVCSRTHSQLNQLVEQLKQTAYRPRMAVLGSKAHYCVNPKLRDAADKSSACLELVRAGGCVYFNGRERLAKKTGDKLLDIEELRAEGRKCAGCPYYASRENSRDAEIVFLPYNYLIDSKIREASLISLDKAIVIIDEAHNIEDVCRDAGSLELTSRVVEIVLSELLRAIKSSAMLGDVKNDFIVVFEMFRHFQGYAEGMMGGKAAGEAAKENGAKDSNARFNSAWQKRGGESQGRDASSTIIKGQKILDELDRMGIKRAEYKTAVRSIADNEDARTLLSLATMQLLDGIEKVFDMLEGGAESYAFCFQHWPEEARYAINIWLLDPSVVFGPLVKRVHAIALLSGTLTPFASFTSELRHTFGHQLVAPHVLKDERVFVASISKGHLGRELCGTYQTAETKEYLDQIVGIVKDVAARVGSTGGVLVFVPNYAFLGKLAKRLAGAIAEPRAGGGAEFDRALRQFQGRIAQKQEAVMLCVYRGKASEGLNFQDSYARAVIAIGIPYPSIRDPQIQLKKEYNDRNSTYNGRQWYEAQAYRAMNQALGRAIRHANDWGAIFLLDSRLAEPRAQQSLSSWVSRNIRRYEHYAASCDELDAFVNRNK